MSSRDFDRGLSSNSPSVGRGGALPVRAAASGAACPALYDRGAMDPGKWMRLFWIVAVPVAVVQLVLVCIDAYLIVLGQLDPTPGTLLKLGLAAVIDLAIIVWAVRWRQHRGRPISN